MMLGIDNGIKRSVARGRSLLIRGAVATVVATSLAGCGFQLVGSGSLPPAMQTTYLDSSERASDFYNSLSEVLRQRGLEVVDSEAEAGARLTITEDLSGQRVLSVSARNIPREYEVFYTVTFSLEADGQALIDAEPLVARRNYSFDETEVLGKEREELMLRRALAEDLARQVIRHIEAVANERAQTPG